MINYLPINLKDKALIDNFFSSVAYRNCDFSFANLFCWQKQYQTTYAILDEFLVIRYICDDGSPCFMMPVGIGNMKDVLMHMINDAEIREDKFRIHAITSEMFQLLDEALPNKFTFTPYRDYFEYIYQTEDLINLSGKKYQQKRNHINRFKSNYPHYRYVRIDNSLLPKCKELYHQWVQEYTSKHTEEVMSGEEFSVFSALDNFNALELKGGAILVDDILIAFSIGQAVTDDTFVIYVEKALASYQGASQIINQQFAATEAKSYLFINREEDLGIPTLRQAKLSYHPVKFLERGSVCLKD